MRLRKNLHLEHFVLVVGGIGFSAIVYVMFSNWPHSTTQKLAKRSSPAVILTPRPLPKLFTYTDRFEDFYEQHGEIFRRKAIPVTYVHFPLTLQWSSQGKAAQVFVELARSIAVSAPAVQISATRGFSTIDKVFIGENSWRISPDRAKWSSNQKFLVERQPLRLPPPRFTAPSHVRIKDASTTFKLDLSAHPAIEKVVVEVATSKDFHPEDTRVYIAEATAAEVPVATAGNYFLRLRGMNHASEITGFSSTAQISATTQVRGR